MSHFSPLLTRADRPSRASHVPKKTQSVVALVVASLGYQALSAPKPKMQKAQNAESPVFAGKTGLLIVRDSEGNHYLMGDEGLETLGPNKREIAGPVLVVARVVAVDEIQASSRTDRPPVP